MARPAVSVRVEGSEDGPPLLLAHALGTSAELWQPQMARLRERHRVLLWELPGHGANGDAAPPAALGDLEAAALAALDEHGIESADFCGVSLGGLVGLALAARHPRRIRRLVVANTAARIGSAEHWAQRIAAVERLGMARVGAQVVPGLFSPAFRRRRPEAVRRAREAFAATSPEGYIGCCEVLREADLRGEVARIRAPTLVIAGEADGSTPPEAGAWLARAVPDARGLTLPAGHLANVEAPAAFADALTRFLTTPEARDADAG